CRWSASVSLPCGVLPGGVREMVKLDVPYMKLASPHLGARVGLQGSGWLHASRQIADGSSDKPEDLADRDREVAKFRCRRCGEGVGVVLVQDGDLRMMSIARRRKSCGSNGVEALVVSGRNSSATGLALSGDDDGPLHA